MTPDAYQPFTSQAEAAAILRETQERSLVADWLQYVEDRKRDDRSNRRTKIKGAIMALLVTVFGVGMFLFLALTLGAR